MLHAPSLAPRRPGSNPADASPRVPPPLSPGRRQGARYWLCAHHPDFPPIHPREGQELRIRGVVTPMVRALFPVPGSHPPPYA